MTASEFLLYIAWSCVVIGAMIAIVMWRELEMTKPKNDEGRVL